MAYNNYNNYNRNNRSNYRGNGRSNRNGYGRRRARKMSWCKSGVTKDKEIYFYGGRRLRSGVQLASAFPTKPGKTVDGSDRIIGGVSETSGRAWERYTVSITSGMDIEDAKAKRPTFYGGFWYPDRGHLIIPELGVMLKPGSDYMGPVKPRK